MNIVSIEYPTPLTQIIDSFNDSVDVFVTLEDGMRYTLVVTTPQNYYWYMDKEGLDYIPASPPDIIVRSLTEDNIRHAIETYAQNDAYWLKLFFLAGDRSAIDIESMNKAVVALNKL